MPLLTYRTGAFAGSGIPIADGMHDYLEMLNERDGGIGGVRIAIEECETGYDAQKGVECYESTKGKGALVYNPYSTGITLQLIPKASVDKIPILSMAYGLSAAAVGRDLPLDLQSARHLLGRCLGNPELHRASRRAGSTSSRARRSASSISTPATAGSRFRCSSSWPASTASSSPNIPVPANQMQNQSSQWLNVRRDRPDYMVMWGWGAMNPTAVKEAAKIRYPMEKFIGVWWSGGEDDARPAGEAPRAIRRPELQRRRRGLPVIQDIRSHVVDKGLSKVGLARQAWARIYNRGVMNSVLIAEAIRDGAEAYRQAGRSTPRSPHGFENLDITEARLKELASPASCRRSRSPARTIRAATPSTSRNGTATAGRRRPTGSRR